MSKRVQKGMLEIEIVSTNYAGSIEGAELVMMSENLS